jgi:hypothetical protein
MEAGEQGSMQIFPNPTQGQFKVQSSKGKVEVDKVELVDLNGKVVESFIPEPGTRNPEFDISKCPAGVYFCRIISGNQVVVKKIVLSK